MNYFEYYIYAYMFELESKLNEHSSDVSKIAFQYDEANSDKELKNYVKTFILKNATKINQIDTVEIGNKLINIQKDNFDIKNVLIPDEYNDEIKDLIKKLKKESVYVNPDLILLINFFDKDDVCFIELKSTKNDKIPGSSIQQITPNEWVIFVKHDDKKAKFITGQYKNTISGTLQFPDRSPRPEVSFRQLEKRIEEYRTAVTHTLRIKNDEYENDRISLLNDWQQFLSDRWIRILDLEKKKNKEPWFNNNLRKFAVQLLEKYDSLNETEKKKYIEFIKKNIEDK